MKRQYIQPETEVEEMHYWESLLNNGSTTGDGTNGSHVIEDGGEGGTTGDSGYVDPEAKENLWGGTEDFEW